MKKIVTGCLGICLSLTSGVSTASRPYIELKSGICMPQEKDGVHYKNAPCFSAELGLSWEAWRLGLQLGHVKYENKDVPQGDYHDTVFGSRDYRDKRFTAISFMTNLYYGWQICEKTTFYVGGGLGMVRLNYRFCDSQNNLARGENEIYNQDKYLLAIQAMGGLAYDITENWSISLGYRCMKIETVKYNTIVLDELWPHLKTPFLHSLEVGLRYSF